MPANLARRPCVDTVRVRGGSPQPARSLPFTFLISLHADFDTLDPVDRGFAGRQAYSPCLHRHHACGTRPDTGLRMRNLFAYICINEYAYRKQYGGSRQTDSRRYAECTRSRRSPRTQISGPLLENSSHWFMAMSILRGNMQYSTETQ